MRKRFSPICSKIDTSRRSGDALGRLLKKIKKKKKKMENSRVLWTRRSRCNWDVLSMFVARVELSDVPEKAYNSRSSKFGGFLACTSSRAIPT